MLRTHHLGVIFTILNTALSLPHQARDFDPPAGCPVPTWTLESLVWNNGSHSLDCVHTPHGPNLKGCYGDKGLWLDPALNCTAQHGIMLPLCATGIPSYQPWGYGPQANLSAKFSTGASCFDTYVGYRVKDLGNGEMNCGYANRANGQIIAFFGSTENDTSRARIDYTLGTLDKIRCEDGRNITYSGTQDFDLHCAHDEFRNATCTASGVKIHPNSWSWVDE